jgi:tetratricopeptide (TPR) repeat protein
MLDTGYWILDAGHRMVDGRIQNPESSIQYRESNVESPISSIEHGAIPEVQGYVALCKAVYWERKGYQAAQHRERAESIESFGKAREQLMSAIGLDPHSSFLYAELAEVLIHLRDYRKAALYAEESLKLNPDNADAHYSRALSLLSFAQRDRRALRGAIEEFRETAELNPEHLGAQSYLARLLFQDEDYSGAARAYSEIVKLRPYDPELRYRLGISYSGSGETAKAIREFNAAAKLRRNYMEPHFHLARLYALQSKNREAIEECLIVLQAVPEDPSMNLLLAELYVSIGEFDKAIPRAKKVLRVGRIEKATLAEAHYRLAAAYKGKKETSLADLHFQKSIDIYKEILEREQENVGVHYDIAMVYDARGDLALAERHLRRHIELRPDEPNAYNFLGYMFVEHDMNLEEAVALIKKAVEIESQNGAFRDSLGWAYFKLGNLDEAIAELEKAAEFIPDDGEVREHLGEAYLKKGRGDPTGRSYIEKAVLEWERSLEMKPKNVSLQQRLGELRSSLGQVEDDEKKENQKAGEPESRRRTD